MSDRPEITQEELDSLVIPDADPAPDSEPEPAPDDDAPTGDDAPTDPNPQGDDGDDDDASSLEAISKLLKETVASAIDDRVTAERDALKKAEDDANLTDEEKRIAALEAENKALAEKVEQSEQVKLTEQVAHEVKSCVGKYKMSEAEVEAVAVYLENNPDLVGTWTFERAALRVFPEFRERIATGAPANGPARGGKEVRGPVAGGSNGPAAPAAIDHSKYRDMRDMTPDLVRRYGNDLIVK